MKRKLQYGSKISTCLAFKTMYHCHRTNGNVKPCV